MTSLLLSFLEEKRYRDYIFDLYGTLADIRTDEDRDSLWEDMADFYQKENASYSPKELRSAYLNYCDLQRQEMTKEWGRYAEPDIRAVFRRLFDDKGIKPSAELVEEAALCFRKSSRDYIRLYDGIEELLLKIHDNGCRAFLLTNAQASFTLPEIRQLSLEELLDDIYISSEAGVAKPDPRFLMSLVEHHRIDLSGALMIGNDRRTDVAVANACGIDSLYVHSNLSPKGGLKARRPREKATYVCRGMDDLRKH